jgi:hypothetical protein
MSSVYDIYKFIERHGHLFAQDLLVEAAKCLLDKREILSVPFVSGKRISHKTKDKIFVISIIYKIHNIIIETWPDLLPSEWASLVMSTAEIDVQ